METEGDAATRTQPSTAAAKRAVAKTAADVAKEPAPDAAGAGEDPWLNQLVGGKFRLVRAIGAGGMAVVYRAVHEQIQREVAIKLLQDWTADRVDMLGRFEREARALAALAHPNIVSLVDFGVANDRPYLVMELLRGRSLAELLQQEGRLPLPRASGIIRQVLRALQYAHGQGLLHRDLKPGNIFLQELPDTSDHVKLLDFGFAKFTQDPGRDGPELSRTGIVFGTPAYIAPEQLTGAPADPRADLYAAAVVFFQMLAGRRPFDGQAREMLRAKLLQAPPRVSRPDEGVEVEPAVEDFIEKALAKKPADRFADATEMLRALDAVCAPSTDVQVPATQAPPELRPTFDDVTPAPVRRARHGRRRRSLGVLVAVAIAVGGGLALFPRPADDAAVEEVPAAYPVTGVTGVKLTSPDAVPLPAVPQDPWASGRSLAPLVRSVEGALRRGERVSTAELTELRSHVRDHPEDAMASLALGHIFAERTLPALAVDAYDQAARIEPSVRGDGRMLQNLLDMAVDSPHRAPRRLLRQVYGEEALDEVEARLRQPRLTRNQVRRLRRLRAQLAGDTDLE